MRGALLIVDMDNQNKSSSLSGTLNLSSLQGFMSASGSLVVVCAWCVPGGVAVLPPLPSGLHYSHGICARHRDQWLAELKASRG